MSPARPFKCCCSTQLFMLDLLLEMYAWLLPARKLKCRLLTARPTPADACIHLPMKQPKRGMNWKEFKRIGGTKLLFDAINTDRKGYPYQVLDANEIAAYDFHSCTMYCSVKDNVRTWLGQKKLDTNEDGVVNEEEFTNAGARIAWCLSVQLLSAFLPVSPLSLSVSPLLASSCTHWTGTTD